MGSPYIKKTIDPSEPHYFVMKPEEIGDKPNRVIPSLTVCKICGSFRETKICIRHYISEV